MGCDVACEFSLTKGCSRHIKGDGDIQWIITIWFKSKIFSGIGCIVGCFGEIYAVELYTLRIACQAVYSEIVIYMYGIELGVALPCGCHVVDDVVF